MTDTHLTKRSMTGEAMAIRRPIQAGLVAAIVGSVANLLVYFLVPALFDFTLEVPLQGPGSEIQPLPATMVLIATGGAAIGGTLVLAILNRFSTRAVSVFRVTAVVLLLLSFPGLFLLDVPLRVVLTLATMHVIAAAAITYVLTRQTEAA